MIILSFHFLAILFLISSYLQYYLSANLHTYMIYILPFSHFGLLLLPFLKRGFTTRKYYFIMVPFFLLSCANWFHFFIFKTELTVGAVASIIATNKHEALGYLTTIGPLYIISIMVFIILYIALFFLPPIEIKNKKNLGLSIFLMTIIPFSIESIRVLDFDEAIGVYYYHPYPRIIRTVQTAIREFYIFNSGEEDYTKSDYSFIQRPIKKSQTLHIVLIGESSRKANWSLYGHYKKTNPLLIKRNDLMVFQDMISPATQTITSLREVFLYSWTQSKKENLIHILKHDQQKVYWLSNQAKFGIYDTPISNMVKSADKHYYINSGMRSYSFDEKLFPIFKKILKEKAKNKIIFVHLMGNHAEYKRRYPKKFQIFNSKSYTKQEKVIAEYNNALVYSDFIINGFIDLVKKENLESTLVYFSDHGEVLYDSKHNLAGHGFPKIQKHEIEIPFLVWLSKKYKDNNKIKLSSLKHHIKTPLSLNQFSLFYTRLLGLKHKYKSILDLNFLPSKRKILTPNLEYTDFDKI